MIDETKREALSKHHTQMIVNSMGFGSIILELHLTDYSLGAVQTKEGKSFWLTDGRRVDISLVRGGLIASLTKEPDEERPTTKFIQKESE